jgi:S-methylmethionine-dependent homocysteine/selenocysteine methylase
LADYNSLSEFPESIDTFVTRADVSSSDIAKMEEYQRLLSSGASSTQLNNVLSGIKNKLFTAEDINKLQACIVNLETYFKELTVEDIREIFDSYEEIMAGYADDIAELKKDINTAIETKIKVAEEALDEIVQEKDKIIASVHDSEYFNFDNLTYRNGYTRKTAFNGDVTTETIYHTASGEKNVYATRTTTKTGTDAYTIVTVCDEVTPKVNTTVTVSKDANGNWIEKVVGTNY